MLKNKGRVLILFIFLIILLFGSFAPHSKTNALDKSLFSEEGHMIQSILPLDDNSLFSDYSLNIEWTYELAHFRDSSELSTRNWIINKTVKLERERSEELRRKALFFFEEKMWDAIK